MIGLLKQPPVPKMAKAPLRRPRDEGNASIRGKSEIDVAVANGDLKDEEVRAFGTWF